MHSLSMSFILALLSAWTAVQSLKDPRQPYNTEVIGCKHSDLCCWYLYGSWIMKNAADQTGPSRGGRRRTRTILVESYGAQNNNQEKSQALYWCRETGNRPISPQNERYNSDAPWILSCNRDENLHIESTTKIGHTQQRRRIARCATVVPEEQLRIIAGTTNCMEMVAQASGPFEEWATSDFPSVDGIEALQDVEFMTWCRKDMPATMVRATAVSGLKIPYVSHGQQYRACARASPGAGNVVLHVGISEL